MAVVARGQPAAAPGPALRALARRPYVGWLVARSQPEASPPGAWAA
jgi:hypothetical protein